MIRLESVPAIFVEIRLGSDVMTKVNASAKPKRLEGKYLLNQTDRDRFNSILKTVRDAPADQLVIDKTRAVNRKCLHALSEWNKENPDNQLTPADIIKSITEFNYKQSKIGTTGPHKGDEMHEFFRIDAPNFTNGRTNLKLYVKFVTPVEGKPIDVISFHRGIDTEI